MHTSRILRHRELDVLLTHIAFLYAYPDLYWVTNGILEQKQATILIYVSMFGVFFLHFSFNFDNYNRISMNSIVLVVVCLNERCICLNLNKISWLRFWKCWCIFGNFAIMLYNVGHSKRNAWNKTRRCEKCLYFHLFFKSMNWTCSIFLVRVELNDPIKFVI